MATNRPIDIDELFGQLSLGDDSWHWYVVYTKPRREKKLADYACQYNINYYLPLVESERVYKYRKVKFTKPLFPGYIFVKCNLLEKRSLLISGHIVRFIKVPDEKFFLDELQQIYDGKERGAEFNISKYVSEGIAVRITSGSFTGLTGVVKDIKNVNEVILRVSMLKQAVSVRVTTDQIEIIKEK